MKSAIKPFPCIDSTRARFASTSLLRTGSGNMASDIGHENAVVVPNSMNKSEIETLSDTI